MTDKGKERLQRNCFHLTLLRVKNERSGEWSFVWECADCGAHVMATTIEMQPSACTHPQNKRMTYTRGMDICTDCNEVVICDCEVGA